MKNFLRGLAVTVTLLVLFDLLILFAALGQVALGQPTGEWNSFWRVQAEAVIKVSDWIKK